MLMSVLSIPQAKCGQSHGCALVVEVNGVEDGAHSTPMIDAMSVVNVVTMRMTALDVAGVAADTPGMNVMALQSSLGG